MTDNELKELVAGLAVSNAELTKKMKETDAQMARTEAQMARTDAQIERTFAQMAKTDAQIAKTDAQIAKTDASLERIGITLGSVTNNIGSITEEYFYNAMNEKPVLGGVTYDKVRRNIGGVGLKSEDEFDIVMYKGNSIALIELRTKRMKMTW